MEDDQQFCLRWNNHQSTLIQNFDTLLESGTLVDCTLAAEGKYLKAHKVVLSACSPYFEGLLSEHYDKHPVFILKDVKFKELKAMMDYMYRGEVNISQDQLAALLKAAESLQIKGLSESKTGGSSKTDCRQQKAITQPTAPSLDIPHASSGLTIEKNKVPRQGISQISVGDLPEDSASPQVSKGLSSREGSQSPTARKRKRFRRRSVGEDNSVENHEASNSSDMPQQMGVPALGIAPVADEKVHADPTDSLGRSALMTQLTKPADEMLQLPLEKPEPNDNLIEPKSEYLEDPEESVEDLTLDDDMNDLNEMEQDNNRAGPSHDPSQHPAGIAAWHVTGDRSNAGGVVGSVAGAPGATDEVFLAAQEAAQAHRDSQGVAKKRVTQSSLNISIKNIDTLRSTNEERNRLIIPSSSSDSDDTIVMNKPDWSVPKKRDFKCKYCDRSFSGPHLLAKHIKYHCLKYPHSKFGTASKEGVHKCDQCGRSFNFQKYLTYHIAHECNETTTCEDCGVKFRGNRISTKHLQVCPARKARAKRTATLRSANKVKNEDVGSSSNRKDFHSVGKSSCICSYCNRSFGRPNNLAKHIKYNCPKNPDSKFSKNTNKGEFSCNLCGSIFQHRKYFNFHVLHQCNKRVKCERCGGEFAGDKISTTHVQVCRGMKVEKKPLVTADDVVKFAGDEHPIADSVDVA